MHHTSLDSSREAFSRLQIPQVHKKRAFYLNHTSQFAEGMEDILRKFGIEDRHFLSADEFRWAYSGGGAWVWEELRPEIANDSPERRASAASSLSSLLSEFALPDRGKEQQVSIALYEELFSGFVLCYQDFIETGFDSVSDFLSDGHLEDGADNVAAFFGDKEDIRRAKEQNEIWTMFDRKENTLYAASTLQGVLCRAWDHDPRLVLSRSMEADWQAPEDAAKGPQSMKMRL